MAHRAFRDAVGQVWEAWEVTPEYLGARTDGQRPIDTETGGWLAFERRGERRRLAPIPPDWAGRNDEDLARLCEEARPVSDPRRLLW